MADFRDLKNVTNQKANETVQDVKDKASSTFDTVKETVSSVASQVQDTVNDYYTEGMKKVECAYDITCEQKDELLERVKDKPLTSILIAGGIGFLLSKILSK